VNDLPVTGLLESIASGEISAIDATSAYLERIERLDRGIGAYWTVDADGALAQAAQADAALQDDRQLGALHGLPVALKDNIDTAGLRTTNGAAFFADRIPKSDAEVTRRLRDAGAVILGKLAMHELAFGATSQNEHYGPCRNPWDTSRVPGGSSGGSGAAVAAGLCAAALGTDTGGSVRVPAALNCISAMRPTSGRISISGVAPITWSLDTVGPMARSVSDLAALLEVLAGYDPGDVFSVDAPTEPYRETLDEGVEGLRIGVPRRFFFEDVDDDIVRLVDVAAEVLATAGASVEEVELTGAADAVEAATTMIRAEALAIHGPRLADEPDSFGADARRRLLLGEAVAGVDYGEARQASRVWCRRVATVLEHVDVLLTPTSGTTAPPTDSEMIETTRRLVRLTYGWSLAGLPALSVPCGFSEEGLPVGLQLAAAPFGEATVLRVGAAYQNATDWHLREPGLVSAKGER
jgi:Asp-tRNA(Asn)/Glu-tRNA(Gln) amidotransferase A subunit family amidase